MENKPLKSVVIYGSARHHRQGIKVARFMMNQLEDRGHEATLLDSEECKLPFLDRMYKEFEPQEAPANMRKVAEVLENADGFVIVSGEYNHSIPSALKNLLDHFQSEYFFKPSAIVTYSAGPFGGVRAMINLRAILAELGTPSIPSAMPVSSIFKSIDEAGAPADEAYFKRAAKLLDEYEWYARALRRERCIEACSEQAPEQQNLCRGQ